MVRLLTEEGGFRTDNGLSTAVSGVLSHVLSSSEAENDNDDNDVFFLWVSGVLMIGIDWLSLLSSPSSDECFWGLSGSLFISSLSLVASVFDNAVTLRLTLDADAFAVVQRLFSMFHSRTWLKTEEEVKQMEKNKT